MNLNKKRYTDINIRENILHLHEEGHTQREIAQTVHVSPSTVNLWINRQGDLNVRKRTGRNRKTNAEQDDTIFSTSMQNPFLSAVDINRQLDLKLSHQTIRNRLYENGLKNFKACKKPCLNDVRKNKRLEFAYKYEHWTADKWETVTFADEKTFQSSGKGFSRVWRPKLSRHDPTRDIYLNRFKESYLHQQKVSGRFSLHIWGCIGFSNILHFITRKTLNGKHFTNKILKTYFSDKDKDFILIQDNSPVHTAKNVQNWLANHITVLDFPPYSPDLNPIENLWGKMEYDTKTRISSCKDDLREIVKEAYNKIVLDGKYIKKLMRSMPRRLQAVIRLDGAITKY